MISKQQKKKDKMKQKQYNKAQRVDSQIANKKPKLKTEFEGPHPKFNKTNKLEALPTITSLLKTPEEQRASKAKYLLPSVLPFVLDYIKKKEGSRVVQMLVKWGDQQVKQQIFNEVKKNWKELIRGKYSVFVLKQLVRNFNLGEIVEETVAMQGIKEAAGVLDVFIKKTANGTQIQAMKKKLRDLGNTEDEAQQQTLDNLAIKIIQKQYYTYSLSKYVISIALKSLVQNERDRVLQYFHPKVLQLINDNEGLRLFCQIVNYSSSKDRKTIVKAFKPQVSNIIESQNHNSYISLLKLLHSVDDTVLLQKNILVGLEPYFGSLYQNKKIANMLYSLFSPIRNNFNIMGKWQSPQHYTTGKKSDDVRASQIRSKIIGGTIEAIKTKTIAEALTDTNISKLVLSVMKYVMVDNPEESLLGFVREVIDAFLADTKKYATKSKQVFESNSLVCHQQAHRVLKNCICISQQAPSSFEAYLSKSFSTLQSYLVGDIAKTLSTRSSYILIALMENTKDKQHILSIVRKSGVNLEQIVGGSIYKSHLN